MLQLICCCAGGSVKPSSQCAGETSYARISLSLILSLPLCFCASLCSVGTPVPPSVSPLAVRCVCVGGDIRSAAASTPVFSGYAPSSMSMGSVVVDHRLGMYSPTSRCGLGPLHFRLCIVGCLVAETVFRLLLFLFCFFVVGGGGGAPRTLEARDRLTGGHI